MSDTTQPQFLVQSLWRYPVKSMQGHELQTVDVGMRGFNGDRAYALVDPKTNKAVSASALPMLLDCQVAFDAPPVFGEAAPAIQITFPDGSAVDSAGAEVDHRLITALNHELRLVTSPGDFFDYAAIHLLATSSLQRLRELYPAGRFDLPRFRPNIVVETGASTHDFIENSWAERTLAIGEDLLLRANIPCPRCVMATMAQGDLENDPEILRIIARNNKLQLEQFGASACLGVYAEVIRPGVVKRGDAVRLL